MQKRLDPITVLQNAVSSYPDTAAFKIPGPNQSPELESIEWTTISYTRFWNEVESCARRILQALDTDGIPRHSRVGIWVKGTQYWDVVQVYALFRAGYIPVMISFFLPNPVVVLELLQKANAKALLCAPFFLESIKNSSTAGQIPVYTTVDEASLQDDARDEGQSLPGPLEEPHAEDDAAVILHTSGSTAGIPKLVPFTYGWLHNLITNKPNISKTEDGKPAICMWVGSICHSSQLTNCLHSHTVGSCVVQPPRPDYTSAQLKAMVQDCGVNCVTIPSSYLSIHLRKARNDPDFLHLLKSLERITYGGLPLDEEDAMWAVGQGFKNLLGIFASTECNIFLVNTPGADDSLIGRDTLLFRPLETGFYSFVPLSDDANVDSDVNGGKLLEAVVLSNSPDCPHVSLRSKEDGHFHTGDLFSEVKPGLYNPRGRIDDWIKLHDGGRCDTRAIENNVRETCGDVVDQCVVVGSLRPRIALVIEPRSPSETDSQREQEIKSTIISRIAPFHDRLMLHERLVDPSMILIVSPGSLPRTAVKGNIRRKAVEEKYKTELDGMYGALQAKGVVGWSGK